MSRAQTPASPDSASRPIAGRIRILHIADKFGKQGSSVHGVSRLFSWWLPRFDRARFDVRLIGLRPDDAATDTLRQAGVEVTSLGKGKFDPSTLPELVGLIRRLKPHILHLHGYGATVFGQLAARLTGVKTIVHEHFVDPEMPAYQGPVDALLSRWMDVGIAVSRSVKTFMVAQRHMPADRVRVIYNGAPISEFQPLNGSAAAAQRARWGIRPEDAVVGTIGRLDEQKGNTYFLEAAATLLKTRSRVTFLVVGDGPLSQALQDQARRLGIAERVVFTGYQSDIRAIQSVLSIQAFPSLWEGTPLTVFEAMATRRPIVSTSVDGLGEVLRDGENALLVPPRDPDALADAMERLLADPALAERLAARAQQDGRQFDIQRTVDQLQAVYEELAGRAAV